MKKEIYYLKDIGDDLKETEKLIKTSLEDTTNSDILAMGRYLLNSPGKRIRPALVFFCTKGALNGKLSFEGSFRDDIIKLASSIEIIHIASLVHDDIVDSAFKRHKKKTLHTLWGEDSSLVFGDYLYSRAFSLLSLCKNTSAFGCIAEAARLMCEGELLQVRYRGCLELDEDIYFEIIKKKTAALFCAASLAGALLIKNCRYREILKDFGFNFGIAFQIIDDYLDFLGDEEVTGKDGWQDLSRGEATLPFLYLYQSLSPRSKKELKNLIGKKENFLKIKTMIIESGAEAKTRKKIITFIEKAKQNILKLPSSCYRDNLLEVSDYIYKRIFTHQSQ